MLVIALSLYHGVNASNLKSPCVVLICLYFCLLSIYNFNYLGILWEASGKKYVNYVSSMMWVFSLLTFHLVSLGFS